MPLPEPIASAVKALPDEVKDAIKEQLSIILENAGGRPEPKPKPPPVDLVRPYKEKLISLGWKEYEVSGISRNPAKFSLSQVMRPGCAILEADAEKAVIKFPSGSIITHWRKPISAATGNPKQEPAKP
jgi:hypothetical protein